MKKYKLKFTAEAQADLVEIWDYITYVLQAPHSAKRILGQIRERAEKLRLAPELKEVVISGRKVRVAHAKKYSLVYDLDKRKAEVQVLRVLYARRNLEKIF